MNFSTDRSERITAIVSTLVAVAILAGGVTAYQSHNEPVDDIVQLESDLRFQLEVAFRHDPNERAKRLVQLEQATQAWQHSPREPVDQAELASWLLEATIRSMPGSIEALPVAPSFEERQQPAVVPTPDVLVTPPMVQQQQVTVENSVAAEVPGQSEQRPTPAPVVATVMTQPSRVDRLETPTFDSDVVSQQPTTEVITRQPSLVAMSQVAKPVRINLTELAARIHGYHDGLHEVETALLRLEAGDFKALTDQIRQLDGMTRDFQFIKMYYQALTNQERRTIAAPRPLSETLAEVERRLDRSQAAQTSDFLEEFDSSNQAQLAVLRQQLSEVSSRIER